MSRTLTRHVVGRAADLPPGGRKLVKAGGREIGVFNVHGAYYALANICPHGGGSLCEGFITGLSVAPRPGQYDLIRAGEFLRCPLHGWEFEIATGQSYCDPKKHPPAHLPRGRRTRRRPRQRPLCGRELRGEGRGGLYCSGGMIGAVGGGRSGARAHPPGSIAALKAAISAARPCASAFAASMVPDVSCTSKLS